jgi:hypothetical protein
MALAMPLAEAEMKSAPGTVLRSRKPGAAENNCAHGRVSRNKREGGMAEAYALIRTNFSSCTTTVFL